VTTDINAQLKECKQNSESSCILNLAPLYNTSSEISQESKQSSKDIVKEQALQLYKNNDTTD